MKKINWFNIFMVVVFTVLALCFVALMFALFCCEGGCGLDMVTRNTTTTTTTATNVIFF
jgi:hypothetical protein